MLGYAGANPTYGLVSIYSQRMQIDDCMEAGDRATQEQLPQEAFRDTKSARFGLGLEFSGSLALHRLSNLVLVAALTLYALMLIGLCAETQQPPARSWWVSVTD